MKYYKWYWFGMAAQAMATWLFSFVIPFEPWQQLLAGIVFLIGGIVIARSEKFAG